MRCDGGHLEDAGIAHVLDGRATMVAQHVVALDLPLGDVDVDTQAALATQLQNLELIHSLFCEVNPIPVKAAMNMMGKNVGPLRGPLCAMEPENAERLKKSLQGYGIL